MNEPIICPYDFVLKRRRQIAHYIAYGISPYYARGEVFPLNYNVKQHAPQRGFEWCWAQYAEEMLSGYAEIHDPFVMAELKPLLEYVYDSNHDLWYQAADDARASVNDCDTYKMTWDGKEVHNVKFEFHGRNAGHLCVTEIDGMNTAVPPHELYNNLLDKSMFNRMQLREIYKLAVQWRADFTQQTATNEVEYQMCYLLFAHKAQELAREQLAA